MLFEADGLGGLSVVDPALGVPAWQPTHAREFFASLPRGERVELNVRPAGFGYWLFDLKRIESRLDRFYQGRRGARSAVRK